MRRFATDVGWVAVYELGEAVRTRLFQLVLLAYVGGVAGWAWLLVEMLKSFEASMAQTLGVPATERPGAMMQSVIDRGDLPRMLGGMIGKDTDVTALLDEPLLALWCGVASMVLLPLVLIFSASGSIASEVKSRSVRYLLCRTGRLEIGLGKLAGQLLIAIVAAAIGGVVAWGMGMTMMVGNPPVGLALALAVRGVRTVLWALPFAGLGLMASQWVASPNGARFIAGGLFLTMPIVGTLLGWRADLDVVGRLCDFAGLFVATTAWADFWSPDPAVLGAAVLRGVVLAVVYYAAGHVVFARRDL